MNWPIRVNDQITYLLQIDRDRHGPCPVAHTFLPIDQAVLYVLDEHPLTQATASQISALTDFLAQIYEGDLAEMGVGVDPLEWDFADRRLMRMICAAVLAGRVPDIALLKRKYNLRDEHGTWHERHWEIVFRALVAGE